MHYGGCIGGDMMKERPICAVEGCTRGALILFGDSWICGNCMAAYDRKMKEQQFKSLQEVLGND